MKKSTLLFAFAAATLFAGSPAAKAVNLNLSAVTPLDTYTIDISAFNYAGTSGYLLTTPQTLTFGTSQTLTGINLSNTTATTTISSSESVNAVAGTTTDTFTVSTPTNFLGANTYNGLTIGQLQFDLGNANSGSNTVDYSLPVTNYTSTGNILYGTAATSFALTPGVTLTNGAQSLAASEGVRATGIYSLGVNSFTFSITYATIPALVPEPSTWAMMGVGLVGCGGVVFRRRRVA